MNPDEYQQQMQRQYDITEAAAKFKQVFWPADPFETGIMTDASYLDIPDLAAIFKAGRALREEGNEAFYHGFINFKRSQDEKWEAVVKVNPLYLDARRQRMLEISELLSDFYFGNCDDFAQKWNEILDMNDPQLVEMLRQVEEVLGLTPREMKVMEVIDED